MKDSSSATPLTTAERNLACVNSVLFRRAMISAMRGCRKVPGEGCTAGTPAPAPGFVDGVDGAVAIGVGRTRDTDEAAEYMDCRAEDGVMAVVVDDMAGD